ncbi:hypothetical protein [Kineosporia babensis]|uniref:Uncharacterized protein n=1 Tax=Kineosporia babensis TaxID=499548 RepID=A0A9X1NCT6_9ACTN|nr:hypothetical protein [Kineosporia babensis]MCD5310896.1 hypothetical protein [Kineosporia babensis]
MSDRIWRAGDAPLAPGTRVRALDVPDVKAAAGMYGVATGATNWDGGTVVDFGIELEPDEMGWDSLLLPDRKWTTHKLEVLDDGGEQ